MTRRPDAAIVPATLSGIQSEGAAILDVIARAAKDPSVDVEKLERLLAIQERLLAEQRRTAYMAAMARLQERLPQIAKSGSILNKTGLVTSRFAKIEDIDAVVRPLIAADGFSLSFNSKDAGARGTEYSCTMSHSDGHSETKTLTLPPDTFQFRTAAQNAGSNVSYARRYLLSMHLNLITRDEDNDGAGPSPPISAEQAERLRAELAEVGGTEARFLNWIAAPTFEEIPQANFARALRFIEQKRGGK